MKGKERNQIQKEIDLEVKEVKYFLTLEREGKIEEATELSKFNYELFLSVAKGERYHNG